VAGIKCDEIEAVETFADVGKMRPETGVARP
jgi:hypothetical protein